AVIESIQTHAAERRLPIAWSAQATGADQPGWVWTTTAHVPTPDERALATAGADTLICPSLEATARWTIDGLIEAEDAWMASPVLPFARHFAQSRGRIGRRI